MTRGQLGGPGAVSQTLDGARSGVVMQHIAHVTPECDGCVVGVVVSVHFLVGIVGDLWATHN